MVALCAPALLAAPAGADLIGFAAITDNGIDSPGIGEAQLFMDVADLGGGQAVFTVFNMGPWASVVSEIYFDGDLAQSIDGLTGIGDVLFGEGGSPPNLPAGNEIDFMADLLASAVAPAPMNGIGAGESLEITIGYAGAFDALIGAIGTGELRVGLHVIAFANGESESFVNVVPSPASLALLVLAALTGTSRRRR
jgi:hypothetical protein